MMEIVAYIIKCDGRKYPVMGTDPEIKADIIWAAERCWYGAGNMIRIVTKNEDVIFLVGNNRSEDRKYIAE